jgi:hypothetical protein
MIMNPYEWAVVIKEGNADAMGELAVLIQVYSCVRKAQDLAAQKFPSVELAGGRGDALRHCYLSALLAKKRRQKFSKDLMDAHEKVEGNPKDDKDMDLTNNAVGRDIALKNPDASDTQLGELCYKAVIEGRTKVLYSIAV